MFQVLLSSINLVNAFAGSYPYKNVDPITINAPTAKVNDGSKSPRKNHDANDDKIIDNETAKPFKMLSAYLTTNAITNPP